MSLNLNPQTPIQASAYNTSQEYTDAVNDSQFVRTFGIVAIVGAILIFISGGVAVGIGLAVIGFGQTLYYRALGIAVVALGAASFVIPLLGLLGPIVLGAGVALKGIIVLNTLAKHDKSDPDWQNTRSRSILGIGLSAAGILIGFVWLALLLIAIFAQSPAGRF